MCLLSTSPCIAALCNMIVGTWHQQIYKADKDDKEIRLTKIDTF